MLSGGFPPLPERTLEIELGVVQSALAPRYRVERQLGHGGMCYVYRARDDHGARDVAIKLLRPDLAVTMLADRFHREITTLGALQHPNILPVLDSGDAGGLLFYVMPFAPGGSLRERLDRDRRLDLGDTLRITQGIAAALDYAHGRNVLHRDIKPENVVFDAEDRALLCDFGVCRAITRAGGDRLSTSGMIVGTPHYMSPEQAAGTGDLDHRSDIYALACLVFEMLAGEPPFTGRTAQAIMAKHVSERPPSVRVVRPEVPARVEAGIGAALAKRPDDRPGSAGAFLGRLWSDTVGVEP
jgi:serine/threonine-protein kinase